MLLMSEGLENQANQLYSASQNLSYQVEMFNGSLGATEASVDQARQEVNTFSELRNETENSVTLALNQVSQLQMASGMYYALVALGISQLHICHFRYCAESSGHPAGLC